MQGLLRHFRHEIEDRIDNYKAANPEIAVRKFESYKNLASH